MKKRILVIAVILGLFLIPNVYAEELPTEGVTYFMTYPNGEEVVTENYEDAIDPDEILLFEGISDSNGQVVIPELVDEGIVRVVEDVPSGYSASLREFTVDLGTTRSLTIVNNSISNPKTGQYILCVVLIMAILMIIFIRSRKFKKVFMIVPIIFAFAFFWNVTAEEENFVINVQDKDGKALSGVTVKVYGKPVHIEGLPAFKVNANGGHFFDGTEIMYVKIPYNGCTWDEMWDYIYELDENYYGYVNDNSYYVYREHYYPDWPEIPATLSNGYTYSLNWEQDNNAQLLTIHGNGGYVDFYGKRLNDLFYYQDSYLYMPFTVEDFIMPNEYVALDNDASCNDVAYGLDLRYQLDMLDYTDDIYLCSSNRADGIYFNGELYTGNKDDCFMNLFMWFHNDDNTLITEDFIVGNFNDNYSIITYPMFYYDTRFYYDTPPQEIDELTKIEIVYRGEIILSVNENEISKGLEEGKYYINNIQKNNIFKNYFNEIADDMISGQCPDYCNYCGCCEITK